MKKKSGWGKLIKAGVLIGGTAVIGKKILDRARENEIKKINAIEDAVVGQRNYGSRRAYFTGGGLASLAGAAYLIRDCGFPAENITVFEGLDVIGGSNDGSGNAEKGFLSRGLHMLNENTCENFWDLFGSIPSLIWKGHTVTEEILNFDYLHPTHARARLVDRDGNIVDTGSFGFSMDDRIKLLKLFFADERRLDGLTIENWFGRGGHFFSTNFWYMWQTAYAFKECSSLLEFRRCTRRMLREFPRMSTLEGVTNTPLDQFDSVIKPLYEYLKEKGVVFVTGAVVTDIDFADGEGLTATALHVSDKIIKLDEQDICIVTNGSMTDSSTAGSLDMPAPKPEKAPMSFELWKKAADKKPGLLGNPEPFCENEYETATVSFTVTCRGSDILNEIGSFTGNIPGSGALMTFKDSPWLLSSVVPAQPHFAGQPADVTVFRGFGLYPERPGTYVKKPMSECTGMEILTEYLDQLHLSADRIEELLKTVINVIPCYMPYAGAQTEPRCAGDRPQSVPAGSVNFAVIGRFVEMPEEMVFTEEYSVRSARLAVYKLARIQRPVCPVTRCRLKPSVVLRAICSIFRR